VACVKVERDEEKAVEKRGSGTGLGGGSRRI